jgi:hypothetical protein
MDSDPTQLNSGIAAGAEAVGQDTGETAFEQTFLSDNLALSLCERYEASKARIHGGEKWTGAVAEFIPFIDAYARDDDHEDLSRGLLARLFEFAYRQNASENKSIQEFTVGVFDVLSQLRHVPDSLMRPHTHTASSKRQPSFFESMMGTIKRYDFMEQLPAVFDDIADGIIVGGSMGYGPFFSVRDGGRHHDPSDVDALIIVEDERFTEQAERPVIATERLAAQDVRSLLGRLAVFTEMREQGTADIISQRFDVADSAFNMSSHFIPRSFFDRMNGAPLAEAIEAGENSLFVARDYKPASFEHAVCAQKSFDGSIYRYEVPPQSEIEGGYLAEIPAYIIDSGKFYPGLYQNLISPEFEVLHDRSGFTTDTVNHLKRTVLKYVSEERGRGHIAAVDLSHIRHAWFAPGRYSQRAGLSSSNEG